MLWKLAVELAVPAHDGESLFLDPAHPNVQGHRLIAEALWPVIEPQAPRGN